MYQCRGENADNDLMYGTFGSGSVEEASRSDPRGSDLKLMCGTFWPTVFGMNDLLLEDEPTGRKETSSFIPKVVIRITVPCVIACWVEQLVLCMIIIYPCCKGRLPDRCHE